MTELIDTNIHLSRWPFRRLPGDETAKLIGKLRKKGVTEAWAGSFDGLFHHDIASVNARLSEECRITGEGLLVPFGSVNPMLPDWREDLRRCREDYSMPGIRLHPNYHGYDLTIPDFAELLDLAVEQNLIVQLVLSMEDERTHHPLVPVPHVDAAPLADLVTIRPKLKLQILNAFRALPLNKLAPLTGIENVSFDIAMLEGVGGVEKLLEKVSPQRVLFGSHSPFFYLESAQLKMVESELGWFQREAISFGNAHRFRNDS
ncbi:Amidohydrolase [Polystyrenella longa]|uniref:Amidohydrolase n=1 Tax=Polystyrenella longa TaxID=2528007 RepID=A0A518CN23_9PLAN|nr:amidohydrolase family protein [Polystyrenella longa]QDU80622.1 Amidohydrolase [Polystyrenella longa]